MKPSLSFIFKFMLTVMNLKQDKRKCKQKLNKASLTQSSLRNSET
jgi:hypothetical protein